MNLAGLFQYGKKNTDNRTVASGKGSISGHAVTGNASQAVKGLAQGQSIHGEVVGKNGNEVQIKVDKDVVITARLDKDIPVSVGQNMTFEVKSNSGALVALRPLFENMAQDANVLKALEAAKLPATNELMQMVSAMMRQGMSIDKNTLMDMGRAVMANVGANPETVVMMKSLNLPVTPENIQQFENYQNYKHQLLTNVTDVLTEIPKAFQSMAATGQGDSAVNFYMQLLNLFSGQMPEDAAEGVAGRVFTDIAEDGGEPMASGQNVPGQDGAGRIPTAGGLAGTIQPDGGQAGIIQPGGGNGDQTGAMQIYGEQPGNIQDGMQAGQGKELSEALASSGGQGKDAAAVDGNAGAGYGQAVQWQDSLAGILDSGSRLQLAAMLGKLGLPEGTLAQVKEGSVAARQLMEEIQQALSGQGEGASRGDLMKLFGSREYNQVLTKAIEQQWLLKPEQVAEKRDVESFYRKLRAQAAQLMDSLGQAGKDTPLAKSLTVTQNNIDFMNQMNQMFQYIQLPLKMGGGEAHGDLYVYANRKHARKEDGSVSALLHLDMEHLGPMDIHVRMKDMDVSTKFYLKDEGMIDFIAAHIHLLDERLRKRGYSFQSEMLVAEEAAGSPSVIGTMMAQEKRATLLAQYSFDVRA